jgi:hypothetical protein
VVKGFKKRKLVGGKSHISQTIKTLEEDIFRKHFDNESLELLQPLRHGRPSAMSDDGWLAWADTEQYLLHFYSPLPVWTCICRTPMTQNAIRMDKTSKKSQSGRQTVKGIVLYGRAKHAFSGIIYAGSVVYL